MRDLRISIAAVTSCLICLGLIMIYSSSGIYAAQELGDSLFFLKRHMIFLGVSLLIMLGVMSVDYRILQRWTKPALAVTVLLLVMVLIPAIGKSSFGARRWLDLGPINFQPSELAKITVVLYVADFLSRKGNKITSLREGFIPLMLVMMLFCALIVRQPDLGSTLLIATLIFAMMFVAGAKMTHLLMVGVTAIPLVAYLVISEPYRMRRIVAFLNPWADSQGVGFQLTQSQIALGSGGIFGVGPGQSVQKLFYLPAAHTDFIFSIVGEELGLIGTLVVILLFGIFIWQAARIAKRVSDPFGYFICIGVIVLIGLQAVVNIGVSIGAFPTKGLPLPFISYGGSALIFNMIAVGLLLNVSRVEDL